MLNLVQISDLHLKDCALAGSQKGILQNLEAALKQTRENAAFDGEWIVVLSGDIYDSASMGERTIRALFDYLQAMIDRALGSPTILLLPGNHDMRSAGILRVRWLWWPRSNVFEILQWHLESRPELKGRVFLYGNETPRLLWHGSRGSQPVDLVAYDSTYLPYGLLSAGGMVRTQDILSIFPQLAGTSRPLVMLLHHHLIPTPVADFTQVQSKLRFLLKGLASNADYEEVMQTALGAGSALSALHRLGRPVVVLHGHKHYPSVRLLSGNAAAEDGDGSSDLGDILLVSAGSAGYVENYSPGHGLPMGIWPSFNHIRIDEDEVAAQVVVYPPSGDSKVPWTRPLCRAKREKGHRWAMGRSKVAEPTPPRLWKNSSLITIHSGASPFESKRRSLCVERTLLAGRHPRIGECWESIDCAKDAVVEPKSGARLSTESPHTVSLATDGTSSYQVSNALYLFADDFAAAYGKREAPYESVELLNRYAGDEVTLSVSGLLSAYGLKPEQCFGSAMDLTLGCERSIPLKWDSDLATIQLPDCPARLRLRIYWPVEIRKASLALRIWRAAKRQILRSLPPMQPGFGVSRWLSLLFPLAALIAIVLSGTASLVASERSHWAPPPEESATHLGPLAPGWRALTALTLPIVPLDHKAQNSCDECGAQLEHRRIAVENARRDLHLSMNRWNKYKSRLESGEPDARKWLAAESAEIGRLGSHIENLVGNASPGASVLGLLALFLGVPISAAYVMARQARRAGMPAGSRYETLLPFALINLAISLVAGVVIYKESIDPLKDSFDLNSCGFFAWSYWLAHLPFATVGLVVSGALSVAWVMSDPGKAPSLDFRFPHCGARPYLDHIERWCYLTTLLAGACMALSLTALAPTRTGKTLAFVGSGALVVTGLIVARLIYCARVVRARYQRSAEKMNDWRNVQPDPTENFLGSSAWKAPTAFLAALGTVQTLLHLTGAARLFGP